MTHVNPRGHLKRSLHGLGRGRLDPERLGLGSDQRPLLVTLLTMGNVTNIMDSEGLGRLGHRVKDTEFKRVSRAVRAAAGRTRPRRWQNSSN